MKIIDLTHTVQEGMPVYPGTDAPRLTLSFTCEKNGFQETNLNLFSHTGTHMDAPAHLFPAGKGLEEFSAEHFCGKALVIPCFDLKQGEEVSRERILSYGKAAEEAEFLLFAFGWDRFWGTPEYFAHYPCPSKEAVSFAVETGKKGIGVDTISVDPIGDPSLPRHRKLLGEGNCLILENLCSLDQIGDGLFWLNALPLKFQRSDGAPVRAVAFTEK